MDQSKRITIMVIPQTGKRTLSLHLAPLWFVVAGVLVTGLIAGTAYLAFSNLALKRDLADLEEVKKSSHLLQVQIQEMRAQAEENERKLIELQETEREIRSLQGSRSSSSRSAVSRSDSMTGRGGAMGVSREGDNLPILSAMLPLDVCAHLFGQRETLDVQLVRTQDSNARTKDTLDSAKTTHHLMSNQLAEMETLAADLEETRAELQAARHYEAHVPSGAPLAGFRITDRFGWRWHPFGYGRQYHNGVDLAQGYGAPVVATGAGWVAYAGWKSGGFGYTVIIDHGYGYQTLYAHLSDWNVATGQEVARGEVIGWVGSTGLSTGPHLHYEVHSGGVPVDPTKYF